MPDTIWPALVTAVLAAAVAGIGYLLGYRRIQYEHLYEQRALRLAELFRLLSKFQSAAMSSINPQAPGEVRLQRLREGKAAVTDAYHYYTASELWLEPNVSESIRLHLVEISDYLAWYEQDLDEQGQPGEVARQAAEHILFIVPEAREQIENEFRAILYPPPWYEKPLRGLLWVDAQARRLGREGRATAASQKPPQR